MNNYTLIVYRESYHRQKRYDNGCEHDESEIHIRYYNDSGEDSNTPESERCINELAKDMSEYLNRNSTTARSKYEFTVLKNGVNMDGTSDIEYGELELIENKAVAIVKLAKEEEEARIAKQRELELKKREELNSEREYKEFIRLKNKFGDLPHK